MTKFPQIEPKNQKNGHLLLVIIIAIVIVIMWAVWWYFDARINEIK